MTICDETESRRPIGSAANREADAVSGDARRCRDPGRICRLVRFASSRRGRRKTRKPTIVKPSDARSGSLLLKTDDGYADATRLGVDVDLTVSGPTIRARVTQIFRNPTQDWVEATYVYPLPAGGAVDTLKMVVGDRVIVGDIKERQQAARDLRAGPRHRAQGRADRAGAAEHLHQFGRQYRPRRNRAGADRVPGAGASVRR